MRIAFLGLGRMGLPMARNLLGLGHIVTVYNRTPGKAKPLITAGAIEASTVADVVKNAEIAITMLADDAAVTAVVHGPGGMLQNLPPKAIHLCMGTMEVETSAALAAAHSQANQGYVAAPVFGRADTAESRRIWIVAGGPESQVNRCRPIFDALGQGYTRVGPNAAIAHALKLGGNMLTIAMELAVSEILPYAKKAGLAPAEFLRYLNTAVFRSHMVDAYGNVSARASFDPVDQTLDLAASELLLQASHDMGEAIPVADRLNSRLQAARTRGWGEQDLAELAQDCLLETGLETTAAPRPEKPLDPPSAAKGSAPTPPKPKQVPPPKEARPLFFAESSSVPPIVRPIVPTPPKAKKILPPREAYPLFFVEPSPVPLIVPRTEPTPPKLDEVPPPKKGASGPQVEPGSVPPIVRLVEPNPQKPDTAPTPNKGSGPHQVEPGLVPPIVLEIESAAPRPKPAPPPETSLPMPITEPGPIPDMVREDALSTPVTQQTTAPQEAAPEAPPGPRPPTTSVQKEPPTLPMPALSASPSQRAIMKRALPQNLYTAMDGEVEVTLDLEQTSHFELVKDQVWAWSQGQRYGTRWSSLGEVELAFNHLLFLLIQRRVLLRPEAVLELRSTFGGGAKARVGEGIELEVSRAAAPRLKVLLGI